MSLVISHVGHWLNSSPALVGDRENNKPPLRKDFLPSLANRHGDEADKQSILLQRKIALFSRTRLKDLTDIVREPILNQLPDGKEGYEKRFSHQVWRDLFELVRSVTGPNFQGQAIARMNAQDVKSIPPQPLRAAAEAMCSAASLVSEISQNPALHDKNALDALREESHLTLIAWAGKQCKGALGPGSLSEVDRKSVV